MSTTSPDADDASTPPVSDEPEGGNPWIVRFFLVLAFGLAFGIEGMTLVRSYLLSGGETPAEQQTAATAKALQVGDDLLPATPVRERVVRMEMRAASTGPWTFYLVVAVANDSTAGYRLTLRDLMTDQGAPLDSTYAVPCAPGDTTRLVATWPMGANVRPRRLTAVGRWTGSGDTVRTARRRVRFGHVPVRMQR